MAIGRISGPMLFPNLERQGVDLSIETDLIYFDVNAMQIGVGKIDPAYKMDISGSLYADSATFINLDSNNTRTDSLSSTDSLLGKVWIQGNQITTSELDQNLIISPNGLGMIDVNGRPVTNLPIPVVPSDATNKQYVDGRFGFLSITEDTIASSTGLLTLDANVSVTGSFVLGDLRVDQSGQTTLDLGNIRISQNTISSTNLAGNINLRPHPQGVVVVESVSGFIPPTGITSDRPLAPPEGLTRYNSETNVLEYWNGIEWIICAPPTSNISSQTINGDGITKIFALDQESTSEHSLVRINGTVQRPNSSYSVLLDQIEFQEAPAPGDVIDVRFITKTFSVALDPSTSIDGGAY